MLRRWIPWSIATLLFCWGVEPWTVAEDGEQRPIYTVGAVFDGPAPDGDVVSLQRLWQVPSLIREEALELTRRDFDLRFPADKQLVGNWDLEQIHQAVDRLLADPDVDIVLSMGVFSSNDVCRRDEFPKPVIAPFVVDVLTQSLPFDGRASGVHNLNYLVRRGSVLQDLRKFHELIPFERLHVLIDSLFFEALPELDSFSSGTAERIGAESTLVPVVDDADAVIAATAGAEAVYLTPLLRLPEQDYDRVLQDLIARGVPTFSLQGEPDVERGWMAGLRRETDMTRWARRVALNIQRVLLGEDAGALPVILDQREKLIINMETAEKIGFFPRWRVTREADLIAAGGSWGHTLSPEELTLSQAVLEAVATNLSLSVFDRTVSAGYENIRLARSAWRPQIDFAADWTQIDADRAQASFGSQPQQTTNAGVRAFQVIYDDEVRADIQIAARGQRALELEREVARLDIALAAASGFLDVLRAHTLDRIEFENQELTEENLQLAQRREDVGFSGPADVYRWKSQLATDRSNSIRAHAAVHQAFVAFNQLLNRPQEEIYTLISPELTDPSLVTGMGRLNPYIDNQRGFDIFREFSVREGRRNSPELRAIGERIAAVQRDIVAAKRSFWAPRVSAGADAQSRLTAAGAGDEPPTMGFPVAGRHSWSVQVLASLPLYAGGARSARVRQSSEDLSRLLLDRALLEQRIELRIRLALFAAAGTFPSIELAHEAVDAARQNLGLVTDSYSRGVVSIIDLLDAQNAALVAEQAAANAVYDFLLDLMELQRSTNDFDFFRSAEGRDAWFGRLEEFFDEAGYHNLGR